MVNPEKISPAEKETFEEISQLETQLMIEQREVDALEQGIIIKKKIIKNGGPISETIPIKPNGKLDWKKSDGKLTSLFAHLADDGPEVLLSLAKLIQERIPSLNFNFETDENKQWIKYTVNEK